METIKNKYLMVLMGVIPLVLGVIFFYVLFDWAMSAIIHSRQEVAVPDLKGKSLADAVTALSSLDLGLKKEGEEFDQSLPPGTIVRQVPDAGMTVREGKIVRVTISQGGKVVFVPDLVGQPVRSAGIAIRSSGLSLGEETARYSLVREKERVLSQDPPAGTTIEKDALVNLVVSAGPPPPEIRLMPDWSGKNIKDAEKWAADNKLAVEIREEKHPEAMTGTILRQEPPPDSDLSSIGQVVFAIAGMEVPAAQAGKVFTYEVSPSGGDRRIRLTLIDENGEKEVFNGIRSPGTVIEVPLAPKGNARVRVFVNNILVEQREIK